MPSPQPERSLPYGPLTELTSEDSWGSNCLNFFWCSPQKQSPEKGAKGLQEAWLHSGKTPKAKISEEEAALKERFCVLPLIGLRPSPEVSSNGTVLPESSPKHRCRVERQFPVLKAALMIQHWGDQFPALQDS